MAPCAVRAGHFTGVPKKSRSRARARAPQHCTPTRWPSPNFTVQLKAPKIWPHARVRSASPHDNALPWHFAAICRSDYPAWRSTSGAHLLPMPLLRHAAFKQPVAQQHARSRHTRTHASESTCLWQRPPRAQNARPRTTINPTSTVPASRHSQMPAKHTTHAHPCQHQSPTYLVVV